MCSIIIIMPLFCTFFVSLSYKPAETTDSSDGAQYAVFINVPAEQCRANYNLNNFLSSENRDTVRTDLNDKKKRLYQGTQMVAARPKGSSSNSVHSERALLMCGVNNQAVTPVQNLLNKNNGGCVVFYTYNSPCLQYCLNQANDDNEENRERIQKEREDKKKRGKIVSPAVKKCILNSLSVLSNHSGPKAFVFSRVYRNDMKNEDKDELTAALKEVAQKVPLYKCDTNSCIKCQDNNQFRNECLS